jgi:hypothetical protein
MNTYIIRVCEDSVRTRWVMREGAVVYTEAYVQKKVRVGCEPTTLNRAIERELSIFLIELLMKYETGCG